MAYRSSYELELDYGFALLEQLEGAEGEYQYRQQREDDPLSGDDSLNELYLEGVFGGDIEPGELQDFIVYNLEWPEGLDEPDEEALLRVREELDGLFSGWVLDERRARVYIPLRDK